MRCFIVFDVFEIDFLKFVSFFWTKLSRSQTAQCGPGWFLENGFGDQLRARQRGAEPGAGIRCPANWKYSLPNDCARHEHQPAHLKRLQFASANVAAYRALGCS